MRRAAVWGALIAMVALFVVPEASGAATATRLTTHGDVLAFTWAPGGDALYLNRAGPVSQLGPERAQVTEDLEIAARSGNLRASIAHNANAARPSPDGREIAFTRLNADGSAALVRLDLATRRSVNENPVAWGTVPEWDRSGGLVFIQDRALARATRTGNTRVFSAHELAADAVASPRGDRAAYVRDGVLWVVSAAGTARIEANGQVLPQMSWAHDGELLAFISTQDGLDPELWIADTTRGTKRRLAQGRLEHLANPAWSPDDTFVIFVRTGTGSAAASGSSVWRAAADGSSSRLVLRDAGELALPQYAPDGHALAFVRDGDLWVAELDAAGVAAALPPRTVKAAPTTVATQETPPQWIRVRHDAANSCRNVPVGQIDTFDFETYVGRVVPAEVYPTWDDDALKTQAVAARSYAWFWILQHGGSAYDVTDSTAYQYFCDIQYAATDAATDQTRGQYLSWQGFIVFAAYGAENGDPTLTNTWGNPYLIGVDDPVGFGQTRAGNGLGMSQWGAQRWAAQFGWNYQQILAHYYTDTTVERPAAAAPDVTPPLGAILMPWSHWGVTSDQILIVVNGSDDTSGVARIDLNASYLAGGIRQNETIGTLIGPAREFVWNVSNLPNQNGVTVTPLLTDGNGNVASGASVTFDLDRKKPVGDVTAPATSLGSTVSLTVNASDGGTGLAGMMFSNNWQWQGENQFVEANSGAVVSDADALNGSALRGIAGVNPGGLWYGPFTRDLPSNRSYRAYFRLKTDNAAATSEVAMLDVLVDGVAEPLGLKRVRGTDFRASGQYQEFYVDFEYAGASGSGLEFRVAYRGLASLWLDRVLVVSYPVPLAPSGAWELAPGTGDRTVIAKFSDHAGNVSADASAVIRVGAPPTSSPTPPPATRTPPALHPRIWLPFLVRGR